MLGLVFDGRRALLRSDLPEPQPRDGWAVLRVRLAGICRTDLEITRGYMAHRGVLGHEFVGEVAACSDRTWIGRRVVGEINAACGRCATCRAGLPRHCPERRVLGIDRLDGCLAELCTLPVANLHPVPDAIPDERAVFTEPLAAAYEILEQVAVGREDRVVVLGDGKLGILCAWVLATASRRVTLAGHHPAKLAAAAWGGVETVAPPAAPAAGADLVVEATGAPGGLEQAARLCRPRGTVVLKSTLAGGSPVDLAPLVVNEITVVGSRCGPFERALEGLERHRFPVERLIAARYPLSRATEALARAAEPGVLKVLVEAG
ncbi:MAG: alcohol dehydrogenase [Acidobacteria bacterium]|nr:MAG: alcohol dehydrogenase [Acidobacteriota bacterium]